MGMPATASPLSRLLSAPRLPVLGLMAAAVAALASALIAEHVFGLAPCQLCWWQRYAFAAAIGVLLPGLLFDRKPAARGVVLGLGAAAYLAGACIALFHAGVEQHWWQGFTACTASGNAAGSLDDLRAAILAAPVVRCDEIAWSLFGLSMAGWNVLYSGGLAVLAGAAAILTFRRSA
ncbi:disulfide bond formation protein B [Aerophototrophica crusticola]|uniref:Disulfide bond formation protein B n=2 Tax=Aerophototrophica crusticola TaxID=1709002 RepID=A0A858R359_9PROT|nr:disulfide bond formation protein B [Rhodospirillaceae bacterium B3]